MFRRREGFDVHRKVEELQILALQSRIPGGAAAPLNQAGDLLLSSGDPLGAVDMYGRAVDSLVEADRFEAGMALCRKIIRTEPSVIRARCTLAWLAIGAGFVAEAAQWVGDYVQAADHAGRQQIAREHVRRMGAVVEVHDLRLQLGEYLLFLGADELADEVFGQVYAERNAGSQRALDQETRWEAVREAALLAPGRFMPAGV